MYNGLSRRRLLLISQWTGNFEIYCTCILWCAFCSHCSVFKTLQRRNCSSSLYLEKSLDWMLWISLEQEKNAFMHSTSLKPLAVIRNFGVWCLSSLAYISYINFHYLSILPMVSFWATYKLIKELRVKFPFNESFKWMIEWQNQLLSLAFSYYSVLFPPFLNVLYYQFCVYLYFFIYVGW